MKTHPWNFATNKNPPSVSLCLCNASKVDPPKFQKFHMTSGLRKTHRKNPCEIDSHHEVQAKAMTAFPVDWNQQLRQAILALGVPAGLRHCLDDVGAMKFAGGGEGNSNNHGLHCWLFFAGGGENNSNNHSQLSPRQELCVAIVFV